VQELRERRSSMAILWSLVQVWHLEASSRYKYDLHTDTNRRWGPKIGLLSSFKTHGDSLCITKGQSESYPLQTYISALLFSPTGSRIRRLFQHEEPREIRIKPVMSDGWSACLQTPKGYSCSVDSVAFSPDSAQLASASWDGTVKIWDASSGACLQTLDIGKALHHMSFDFTGCFLYTEIGTIVIQTPEVSRIEGIAEPELPCIRGQALAQTAYGLSMQATTCCGYHRSIGRHARFCAGLWLLWVLGLEEYGIAGSTSNLFNSKHSFFFSIPYLFIISIE
jgi:hypothetical protein